MWWYSMVWYYQNSRWKFHSPQQYDKHNTQKSLSSLITSPGNMPQAVQRTSNKDQSGTVCPAQSSGFEHLHWHTTNTELSFSLQLVMPDLMWNATWTETSTTKLINTKYENTKSDLDWISANFCRAVLNGIKTAPLVIPTDPEHVKLTIYGFLLGPTLGCRCQRVLERCMPQRSVKGPGKLAPVSLSSMLLDCRSDDLSVRFIDIVVWSLDFTTAQVSSIEDS